jgi:hypothetical protein
MSDSADAQPQTGVPDVAEFNVTAREPEVWVTGNYAARWFLDAVQNAQVSGAR